MTRDVCDGSSTLSEPRTTGLPVPLVHVHVHMHVHMHVHVHVHVHEHEHEHEHEQCMRHVLIRFWLPAGGALEEAADAQCDVDQL